MAAKSSQAQSKIDGNWIPSSIPNLHIYSRDKWRLCLNPDVPSWIITTEAAVFLLKLADGHRTVDEIADAILAYDDVPIYKEQVLSFFAEAKSKKLFSSPAKTDNVKPWEKRRLMAMHLHLTDRCNLQCNYCLRKSTPYIPLRHEPEQFIKMMEYIKPISIPKLRITYSGGEPLIYPSFKEVVKAATECGYENQLLTNGILITESLAEFIGANFTKVRISLDGIDRKSHAATRGDNFNQVVRGIHLMSTQETEVTVQITLTKSNQNVAVAKLKKMLPDVVRIAYTPMLPFGRAIDKQNEFITDDEFLYVSRDWVRNRNERIRSEYFSGVPIFTPCHAGYSNLSIADSGNVYPCHLFHSEDFYFGNIFHDSLDEIFFGDKVREYVRYMDVRNNNPECASCEMRFLCAGGCKANSLHATGTYRAPDLYCSYIKNSIIDNIFDSSELGTINLS